MGRQWKQCQTLRLSSQGYDFSSSHVWIWELDSEESWEPKNWYFWTVVLEKTLESPLDCKEIQPVHSKDQSWVFTGRSDAEAETPVLRAPDAKSWLIWKDPDAGKDWGQEKGTREDEMVGWHHWLNGHEFGWAPGVGDGQGSLACCNSWGRKQLATTGQLNWWTKYPIYLSKAITKIYIHMVKRKKDLPVLPLSLRPVVPAGWADVAAFTLPGSPVARDETRGGIINSTREPIWAQPWRPALLAVLLTPRELCWKK